MDVLKRRRFVSSIYPSSQAKPSQTNKQADRQDGPGRAVCQASYAYADFNANKSNLRSALFCQMPVFVGQATNSISMWTIRLLYFFCAFLKFASSPSQPHLVTLCNVPDADFRLQDEIIFQQRLRLERQTDVVTKASRNAKQRLENLQIIRIEIEIERSDQIPKAQTAVRERKSKDLNSHEQLRRYQLF